MAPCARDLASGSMKAFSIRQDLSAYDKSGSHSILELKRFQKRFHPMMVPSNVGICNVNVEVRGSGVITGMEEGEESAARETAAALALLVMRSSPSQRPLYSSVNSVKHSLSTKASMLATYTLRESRSDCSVNLGRMSDSVRWLVFL